MGLDANEIRQAHRNAHVKAARARFAGLVVNHVAHGALQFRVTIFRMYLHTCSAGTLSSDVGFAQLARRLFEVRRHFDDGGGGGSVVCVRV